MTCLRPGGGAFVVDGGRPGHRAAGIPGGGAADPRAQAAANRLLGQPLTNSCLELTLVGGKWRLEGTGQFVITGADMDWLMDGKPLKHSTVHRLSGESVLTGKMAKAGLRAYLSIRGDWDLPRVLGSREAGLPGISSVEKGWETRVTWATKAPEQAGFPVNESIPETPYFLRVVPGPEWDWLTAKQQKTLLQTTFRVSRDSSRQGIRLEGLKTSFDLPSLISSPVLPGTVQLAPAGPILLGPTAQTIGGYPRVLLVTEGEHLAGAFQVGLGGEVVFLI